MKTCKQCSRSLDDDKFRKTRPRGRGIYKTTQGSSSICKDCESLNNRANQLKCKMDAGEPVNQAIVDRLKRHYELLTSVGRPPITAAARRFMGLEPLHKADCLCDGDFSQSYTGVNPLLKDTDLYEFQAKVRARDFASFDEADKIYRTLVDRLRDAGLYEDITNMIDEWFEED